MRRGRRADGGVPVLIAPPSVDAADDIPPALAQSRPRLSPGVQVRRISFRGRPVYVLHSPVTGRYLRTPPRTWRLLALLDGRRTLAEALARLPRAAAGEPDDRALADALAGLAAAGVISIVGARATAPSGPGPTLALLRGAMVTRVRLGDLAPVLRTAGGVLALPYTRVGAASGALLLALAAVLWSSRGDVLDAQIARLADPGFADLVTWYLIFIASKTLHECGHAVAAQRTAAAEAHRIDSFPFGVAMMFLLPTPYVDVSGTWFVADRRRRALVGIAGIWMDLCVAAAAACLAAVLAEGALRDRLCELVVIASVSSLLFNGNPLVRLDGYYVLSDLLEIPNLQTRAFAALRRCVGLVFGGSRPRRGDAPLAAYGLASLLYRFVIFGAVLLLAGWYHWTLAVAVAVVVAVFYFVLPAIAGGRALLQVGRRRPLRAAVGSATAVAVVAALVLVPVPRWRVAHGIAWNDSLALVYPRTDGRVVAVAAAGTSGPAVVMELRNPEVERLRQQLALEAESLGIEARRARAEAPDQIDAFDERTRAVADQETELARETAQYRIAAAADVRWQPLRAERLDGGWVRRDDPRPLGALVGDGPTVVRMVVGQADGPDVLAAIAARPDRPLPVRRRGEAAELLTVVAVPGRPDARDELPSPALAQPYGGPFAVQPDPADGSPRTLERVYEVRLLPTDPAAAASLLHGTRVEVRLALSPQPLAVQAWQAGRKLLQQRLGT